MLGQIAPLQQTESVALTAAAGRITAAPVVSPLDVPPFANSAMDGYALRLADLAANAPLPVAGKAFAGAPFDGQWPANSCVRIMTGAPIPAGADAVVMQEQAEVSDRGVRFTAPVEAGQNIRLAGEDIRRGASVLPAGVKLGAAQLPLLASLGVAEVQVMRKLKVAVFSTGDELQPVGQPLQAGQIYDTNRFAVRLMLEQLGCEVLDLGIIRDDRDALRAAFERADSQADVVISSGGVSVGEADYTNRCSTNWASQLLEAGDQTRQTLRLRQTAPRTVLRPAGQPGFRRPDLLPAGAAAAGEAGRPQRLAPAAAPAGARIDAAEEIAGPPRFPARRVQQQRRGRTGGQHHRPPGSHVFSSYSRGNCFIVLERERGSVAVGETVEIEPFNALLRS